MPTAVRAVLVLLLILPGGPGWSQPAVRAPAVMLADWDVFAGKGCARCHRVRGLGDGATGPDLARLESGTGFFEIAAAMWNHLPRMRAATRGQDTDWPRVTPQELSNLIAFLFTAQSHHVAGDPVTGARLFAARGCAQCHAAPTLAELGRAISPMGWAAAMWNHASQMGEAMRAAGMAGSTLSGTDLPDLVAYLQAARRGSRGEAPIVVGVAERGKLRFADKGCARCHAVGETGSGPGPSLRPRASRVTVTGLAGRMWNHGHAIRRDVTTSGIPVPRLTEHEMADIVAHLHASFYFDGAEGDGRRGRRLVQAKCLGCHSVYNAGKAAASDLARANVVSSQVGQLAAMWNHGRHMDNQARRQDTALLTLSAQELSDITRYLAGLGSIVPRAR
jgi:mono/diheme cytochrome c family protein